MLPDELLTFVWEIPQGRFRWEKDLLVCDSGPLDRKRYFPLKDETGLFRVFADTPSTPEGIAAFAAKYGFLGYGRRHSKGGDRFLGESGDAWRGEIEALRDGVTLWDAARTGASRTLEARITLDPDGRRVGLRRGDGVSITVENADWHRVDWGGAVPANLSEAALFLVQDEVNGRLDRMTRARLLYHPQRPRLTLHIVPADLLGALWLQFAEAIAGNKDYRRCDQCGRWFVVSPDKNRTSRRYCSNACKSKAYRGRNVQKEGDSNRQQTQ